MKVLLDTSTLLAAIVSSHPGHARAKAWLDLVESKKISAVVCMHSLAEVYANLTRVPFTVPPAMAVQLIDLNIRNKFEEIALSATEYYDLLEQLATQNISGPKIYDGIIACCAWKAEVDFLVTLNRKDFIMLYPTHVDKIVETVEDADAN